MIKLIVHTFFVFLLIAKGYSQNSEIQKSNLDFEINENGYPATWKNYGGSSSYNISLDSLHSKSGKFSAVIESIANTTDFKALAFSLPDNYKGKSIRLSGYIKTENVTDGYAGLWMRIDPQIGFDNMNDRGITGTTDWTKYEIVLPLNPKKTDQIVIGGLLVGRGKMWLDNLKVSIDGKDLDNPNLEIYTRELLPAEKDKEFDNQSGIEFPNLNETTINNLELLGRIWGFLKYHHPEIAKGNYNWDYELFRLLPKFLEAKNIQERDQILLTWITKYGKLPECQKCKPTSPDAVLKPDLSWIDNSDMTNSLQQELKEIYANRNQSDNYYISLTSNVGNPDFKSEKSYSKRSYPDSGFRLLSLYRYWNIIAYFFPNKHLTNQKWETVLKKYIPKFLNAKDELEYELAALQVIAEVDDTHANLWRGGDKIAELRGNNFAAFRGEFVEDKFVVTDYYNPEFSEESKLKIGDIITQINGKTVESIVDSLKSYYPASNEAAMLRDISADLLRSPQNTLVIDYISDKNPHKHSIQLYDRRKLNLYQWYKVNETEKSYKILDGNIGYVTLANIKEEDISVIKKSFKNTKGIIIDIRNYPSTFVPFALGSYFMDQSTPFVKFTNGNVQNPGEFTFTNNLEIPSQGAAYKGKLVVLVNENSQSQSEYTAMAFKAVDNSTIIGSTTAGADGNVSTILLPGGLRTMISGIGIYYPDGTETQRVGIVPDLVVKPTIEGIKKGRDEVLEKAIETINH